MALKKQKSITKEYSTSFKPLNAKKPLEEITIYSNRLLHIINYGFLINIGFGKGFLIQFGMKNFFKVKKVKVKREYFLNFF